MISSLARPWWRVTRYSCWLKVASTFAISWGGHKVARTSQLSTNKFQHGVIRRFWIQSSPQPIINKKKQIPHAWSMKIKHTSTWGACWKYSTNKKEYSHSLNYQRSWSNNYNKSFRCYFCSYRTKKQNKHNHIEAKIKFLILLFI